MSTSRAHEIPKFLDGEIGLKLAGQSGAQKTKNRNRPRNLLSGLGFRRNLVESAQFFAPDLILQVPELSGTEGKVCRDLSATSGKN